MTLPMNPVPTTPQEEAPQRHAPSGGRRPSESVSDRLAEMALDLGPGAKLPTVAELCRQLGTSRATLDEALARPAVGSHGGLRRHARAVDRRPGRGRVPAACRGDARRTGVPPDRPLAPTGAL